jgi:hypothetical protein
MDRFIPSATILVLTFSRTLAEWLVPKGQEQALEPIKRAVTNGERGIGAKLLAILTP